MRYSEYIINQYSLSAVAVERLMLLVKLYKLDYLCSSTIKYD